MIRHDKLDRLNYNDGKSDKKLLAFLKFLNSKNQRERDEIVKNSDKIFRVKFNYANYINLGG